MWTFSSASLKEKKEKRVKALRPGPARVHAHSLTALERKLAIPFVVISSGAKRWQKKKDTCLREQESGCKLTVSLQDSVAKN